MTHATAQHFDSNSQQTLLRARATQKQEWLPGNVTVQNGARLLMIGGVQKDENGYEMRQVRDESAGGAGAEGWIYVRNLQA